MVAFLTALTLPAAVAPRSAPPVGPLPPSPATTIGTASQELVGIALPRGQLYEADVPNTNVTVFVLVAGRAGTTTVMYGLTNGEHSKAYRAARFRITVSPRP